ncbi:ParB/RepB/Spo0J family partition protein [Pseudonocardia kunmingensis]|uniref:ParB family chromosome partitioning protein n=1 Tax=Pseudonocardia kunmingensis TaxID=630975 RepID=A0A543CWX3_9PSEU|nr:ParB/RepB/Spo0J family partition protein [Pseudonocardia kunmingensis]TQM01602.1 ParB family chromosome partitioning protein [Pseudonocardia kunmingensis]
MAGKRINLAELADDPLEEARVPSFVETAPRSARVEQVAANPKNTRDVHGHPEKIANIAESIRLHGQLQPCTVVTRDAFLAIFPDHTDDVGQAAFVQVTGGRRRAAVLELGLSTIDITVKNALAESRAKFISATAAENIDREDYDLIEEARAVQLLVQECGTGKGAAEQLARTPPWVTQRLNLLKLEPELHAALRAAEIPLREVRDLHKRSRDQQLAALSAWQRLVESRQQVDGKRWRGYEEEESDLAAGNGSVAGSAEKTAASRRSPVAAAIIRLGGTPAKIAQTLRAELSPEDRQTLAEELMRES